MTRRPAPRKRRRDHDTVELGRQVKQRLDEYAAEQKKAPAKKTAAGRRKRDDR